MSTPAELPPELREAMADARGLEEAEDSLAAALPAYDARKRAEWEAECAGGKIQDGGLGRGPGASSGVSRLDAAEPAPLPTGRPASTSGATPEPHFSPPAERQPAADLEAALAEALAKRAACEGCGVTGAEGLEVGWLGDHVRAEPGPGGEPVPVQCGPVTLSFASALSAVLPLLAAERARAEPAEPAPSGCPHGGAHSFAVVFDAGCVETVRELTANPTGADAGLRAEAEEYAAGKMPGKMPVEPGELLGLACHKCGTRAVISVGWRGGTHAEPAEPAPEGLRDAVEAELPPCVGCGDKWTGRGRHVKAKKEPAVHDLGCPRHSLPAVLAALSRFRWQSAAAELRLRAWCAEAMSREQISNDLRDRAGPLLATPPSPSAEALAELRKLPGRFEAPSRSAFKCAAELRALLRRCGVEPTP